MDMHGAVQHMNRQTNYRNPPCACAARLTPTPKHGLGLHLSVHVDTLALLALLWVRHCHEATSLSLQAADNVLFRNVEQ